MRYLIHSQSLPSRALRYFFLTPTNPFTVPKARNVLWKDCKHSQLQYTVKMHLRTSLLKEF